MIPTLGEKEGTMPGDEEIDLLQTAWAIIANAGGGDWERETAEWQKAAAAWRERYYPLLAGRFPKEEEVGS